MAAKMRAIVTRRRTGSWLALNDPVKGTRCNILFVLVHGFRYVSDKSYDHGLAMESWLGDLDEVKNNEHGNAARSSRFDMSQVLVKGKPEFETERDKLYQRVHNKVEELKNLGSTLDGHLGPEDAATTSSAKSGESPSTVLIFITHGLGLWLVEDLLTRVTSLAIKTRGLIPLDCITHATSIENYSDYISRFSQTFSFPPPTDDKLTELGDLLQEIDSKFIHNHIQNYQDYLKGVAQGSHLSVKWVVEPFEIWPMALASRPHSARPSISRRGVSQIMRIINARTPRIRRGKEIPNKLALTQLFFKVVKNHKALKLPISTAPPAQAESRSSSQPGPSVRTSTASLNWLATGIEESSRSSSPAPSQLNSVKVNASFNPRDSNMTLPAHTAEWQGIYEEAKALIKLGDFRNASILCDRAKNILRSQGTGAVNTEHQVNVQMQIEIITLLRGSFRDFQNTTKSLRSLRKDCETLRDTANHQKTWMELGRWLAESLALQGKFREAASELGELALPGRKTSPKVITIPTSFNVDDRVMDLELAVFRDLALAFAYLGFFTRAQRLIRFLLRYLDEKLAATERQVDKEKTKYIDAGTELGFRRSDTDSDPKAGLMTIVNGRDSMLFAAAVIYTLSGNYTRGLRIAEEAWRGRKQRLGSSHVKTLEAASLRAQLLALTSNSREAESLCRQILKALSSTEMGLRHPQAIGTMMILVFIFRKEYRLIEAVDTGRSLCRVAEESMDPIHPETLKARAEFASSLRSAGDYKSAEAEYSEVVDKSRQVYEMDPEHPEVLRYESELAHTYACIGRLDDAETLALDTLWKQRHAYQFERSELADGEFNMLLEKPMRESTSHESAEFRLDLLLEELEFEYILDEYLDLFTDEHIVHELQKAEYSGPAIENLRLQFVGKLNQGQIATVRLQKITKTPIWQDLRHTRDLQSAQEGLRSRLSDLRVHPSLLHTLEILGWIEEQRQDADIDLVCRMIEIILKWRRRTLGEFHDLSLVSEYDLAMANREHNKLEEARQGFRTVFSQRSTRPGKAHPDTLAAKRELTITCCGIGLWDENLDAVTKPLQHGVTFIEGSDDSENSQPPPTPPTREFTLEDWTLVERSSKEIAASQESRIGANHPETINTLLWVFAVQLLVGLIKEASRTMETLCSRLRDSGVRDQRLLNALHMEEKIAWICMEQKQAGYALDLLHFVKHEAAESLKTNRNNTLVKELEIVESRCDDRISMIYAEANELAEAILDSAENEEEAEDRDVYLINVLKLGFWLGFLGKDRHQDHQRHAAVETTVDRAKTLAGDRFKELIKVVEKPSKELSLELSLRRELLKKAFTLLDAAYPDRAGNIAAVRDEVEGILTAAKVPNYRRLTNGDVGLDEEGNDGEVTEPSSLSRFDPRIVDRCLDFLEEIKTKDTAGLEIA